MELPISPIAKSSGSFKSFDGTPIYYEVLGQGKPIVFIYGIACLINHWHHQIHHLSQNYQTIIFDYRGHHFSGTPEDKNQLSLPAISHDVIALCDHLKIDKAVFLGHSFGCEVLLQSFLLKPELFVGAGLVSGFFKNPFEKLATAEQIKLGFQYVKRAYNAAPDLVSTVWKLGVTNPISVYLSALSGGFNLKQTAIKDIEIYAQGVANIDFRVFVSLFEQLIAYNGLDDLPKLNKPTLVIGGTKDALTPVEFQEQIHSLVASSELVLVDEGSHCVQLDFPDIVNNHIDQFLKKLNY